MMPKNFIRYLWAVFFILAGVNHFLNPQLYLKIMPPYLPWPLMLIYLSGYAEVYGGCGLLVPQKRFRYLTAWGLVVLLIAVFPVNIHMALHSRQFADIPAWVLWVRLPFQAVFMGGVLWAAGESGGRKK